MFPLPLNVRDPRAFISRHTAFDRGIDESFRFLYSFLRFWSSIHTEKLYCERQSIEKLYFFRIYFFVFQNAILLIGVHSTVSKILAKSMIFTHQIDEELKFLKYSMARLRFQKASVPAGILLREGYRDNEIAETFIFHQHHHHQDILSETQGQKLQETPTKVHVPFKNTCMTNQKISALTPSRLKKSEGEKFSKKSRRRFSSAQKYQLIVVLAMTTCVQCYERSSCYSSE